MTEEIHYKSAASRWFHQIPDDWHISKLKFLVNIFTGNSLNDGEKLRFSFDENPELKGYNYISSKDIDVGTRMCNYDTGIIIPTSETKYKVAPSNSTLLCIEGGSAGKKITFTTEDVCFVNKLACFKSTETTHSKFVYYFLQSNEFKNQFQSSLSGLIGGVSLTNLNDFEIPVPPLSEQQKIADFLDRKTTQIDTIIEKKQKLLQLLDEKRKSVINEAVTGQKVWDGNAWVKPSEVKESGVEWIGEIPVDWSVLKMRRILELKSGDFISANDIEAEGVYPVYGGNGIRGYTTKFNREGTFPLIGRQGALCGNVNYSSGKFWATEHALLVYPLKDLNLSYYGELLEVMNLNQYSVASAQPGLSVERLLDLEILFPPVSNQILIADFITKQRSKFNDIMEKVSLQIIKLQEYRQSLISEAVTGKIDVTNFN